MINYLTICFTSFVILFFSFFAQATGCELDYLLEEDRLTVFKRESSKLERSALYLSTIDHNSIKQLQLQSLNADELGIFLAEAREKGVVLHSVDNLVFTGCSVDNEIINAFFEQTLNTKRIEISDSTLPVNKGKETPYSESDNFLLSVLQFTKRTPEIDIDLNGTSLVNHIIRPIRPRRLFGHSVFYENHFQIGHLNLQDTGICFRDIMEGNIFFSNCIVQYMDLSNNDLRYMDSNRDLLIDMIGPHTGIYKSVCATLCLRNCNLTDNELRKCWFPKKRSCFSNADEMVIDISVDEGDSIPNSFTIQGLTDLVAIGHNPQPLKVLYNGVHITDFKKHNKNFWKHQQINFEEEFMICSKSLDDIKRMERHRTRHRRVLKNICKRFWWAIPCSVVTLPFVLVPDIVKIIATRETDPRYLFTFWWVAGSLAVYID